MRRLLHCLLLALSLSVGVAASASAAYGPASLLSGTTTQEFTSADAPALAAGGGYAAFQGMLGNTSGVWVRNLRSGAIDLVAGSDTTDSALSAPDAAAPSISADGRYVAFTTTADLDPADEPSTDRGCPEVYVRDMTIPIGSAGAYRLAAALDGTATGITFATCKGDSVGTDTFQQAGAQAAPAVALSADGSEVVFTVLGASNVTDGGNDTSTPASQVVVRNMRTDTTTIVSVTPSGTPTPGGGAFPSTVGEANPVQQPLPGVTFIPPTDSTASISADGSTVAWLGTNVPAQVPSATDVIPGIQSLTAAAAGTGDQAGLEIEPLWRRVADGTGAVTQRLLADAGLDFYANTYQSSAAGDQEVMAGSLPNGYSIPVLSADGTEAAVVSDAPTPAALTAYQADYPDGFPDAALPADVYAIHVTDTSSTPQVIPVTSDANYYAFGAATATATAVGISADGSEVGFETARTDFSPFALITPASAYDHVTETYVADLSNQTLQLVTSTYDHSAANGNAGLLDFSGDGQSLAFASTASDLFYGDVYPANAEVYLASAQAEPTAVAATSITVQPGVTPPPSTWTLNVSAKAQSNGTVVLTATVPGAGKLSARAGAQIASLKPASTKTKSTAKPTKTRVTKPKQKARLKTAAKQTGTSKKATGTKKPTKSTPPVTVPTTTIATASQKTVASGRLQLTLKVHGRYASLVDTKDGLYAVVNVTFTCPGRPTISRDLPVMFRGPAASHPRTGPAKATPTKKSTKTKTSGATTRPSHGASR